MSKVTFFSLSAELRQSIYGHMFPVKTPIHLKSPSFAAPNQWLLTLCQGDCHNGFHRSQCLHSPQLLDTALFAVSQQLRAECVRTILARNILILQADYAHFLAYFVRDFRDHIDCVKQLVLQVQLNDRFISRNEHDYRRAVELLHPDRLIVDCAFRETPHKELGFSTTGAMNFFRIISGLRCSSVEVYIRSAPVARKVVRFMQNQAVKMLLRDPDAPLEQQIKTPVDIFNEVEAWRKKKYRDVVYFRQGCIPTAKPQRKF